MNSKLRVVRFRSEDVIAASARRDPSVVCDHIGRHFYTTGPGVYNEKDNTTSAPGTECLYFIDPNIELIPIVRGRMTVPGKVDIPAGKYFYFSEDSFKLCEIQFHSH